MQFTRTSNHIEIQQLTVLVLEYLGKSTFLLSVTKIAIREARLKEIRQEILNSTQLQAHLADNPKDAKVNILFSKNKILSAVT